MSLITKFHFKLMPSVQLTRVQFAFVTKPSLARVLDFIVFHNRALCNC